MSLFKEEIDRLETMDIKTFAENALKLAPDSFKEDEQAILYTRKIFKLVESFLDSDQVHGNIRDVILTGVLLSDLAVNEEGRFIDTHPLLVRPLLKDIEEDLVPQLFEGIMRIVEAHEGKNTPIRDLEPKPGSPEHLVAIAHVVAQSKSVQITL